jgi:hypothetical protein
MMDSEARENPFLASLGGKEEWERFLAKVRESKLTLGIWLMSADVAGIEGDSLILSFTPQNRFAMEMIRQDRNRRLIEDHLEKFYGRKFTVEACETVNLGNGSIGADRQAELEIAARTRPRDGGEVGSARVSASGAGDANTAAGKGGAGNGGGAGSRGVSGRGKVAGEVANPTLRRIMEEFDAELID